MSEEKKNREGIDQRNIKHIIREIPDFPEKGMTYHDVTPLWNDWLLFDTSINTMVALLSVPKVEFDTIVAIEAASWIHGSALAFALMKKFVPAVVVGTSRSDLIRCNKILPADVVTKIYDIPKNNSNMTMARRNIVIHRDAILPGQKVVILDEMIGTGHTAEATAALIEKIGGEVAKIITLLSIEEMGGHQHLIDLGYSVGTCVSY